MRHNRGSLIYPEATLAWNSDLGETVEKLDSDDCQFLNSSCFRNGVLVEKVVENVPFKLGFEFDLPN